MEIIKVKSQDDVMILSLNDEVEFSLLIQAIEERLTVFKEKVNECPKIMRLELGAREITPNQLHQIFDLVLSKQITYIDGIDLLQKEDIKIEVLEGTLRGGQVAFYENSVMVLGDINPGAVITARYNVYVVGKILGKVVIKSEEGKIVASKYQNCVVQLFDAEPQNIEFLDGGSIEYGVDGLKIIETNQSGGKEHGKSNRRNVR